MPKGRKGRRSKSSLPVLHIAFVVVFVLAFLEALIISGLFKENLALKARLKTGSQSQLEAKPSVRQGNTRTRNKIAAKKRQRKVVSEKTLYTASGVGIRPASKKKKPLPKLVIVLDDWGYSNQNFYYLRDIALKLDISVLPNHRYSRAAAEMAHRYGKEVMLHLPMEPLNLDKRYWEGVTITTDMDNEQIRQTVLSLLDSVPYVMGVNNHMGSKATADRRVMDTVAGALKGRVIFLVDSVSSSSSVVCKAARNNGMRCLKRDVFIDNDSNISYIKSQLRRALRIAEKKGYAVAIGHDRVNTLRAILEMETELLTRAEVVTAGELVSSFDTN